MPVLIANGPDVPIELLNDLDDGKLVLFCGAGISIGTDLPTFEGLVDYVYQKLIDPSDDRFHHLRPKLSFDKRLGLLENQLASRTLMRGAVVKRLSRPTSKNNLKVHKAILALATTEKYQLRLVTGP